jgi:multidrug efflux pump subunit AcrB
MKKTTAGMKKKQTTTFTKSDANVLPKFSLFFFDRPRLTALLFFIILAFGILSYTTLLKREGFPSISIPVSSVSGAYFVNDPATVDNDVVKPISEIALEVDGVKTVQAQSFSNFFTVFIQFEEGTDAKSATATIEQKVTEKNVLPTQAAVTYSVPYFGATGGALIPIDLAISFYGTEGQTTEEIAKQAEVYAKDLQAKNLSLVKNVQVLNPFTEAQDPATGQLSTVQETFDRFGIREELSGVPENNFYNSVIVAIEKTEGADLIKFDEQVREAVAEINTEEQFTGYSSNISASFAPNIEENISELQRELIIALIAVLIVGSIVIAIRASIITVISMILVIFAVLGILYLLGFTLNVITLFALILSLALIVDDTIIMVEALDAQRKKHKDARRAVDEATHKISRAMLSATSTAALSFLPLVFVTGILGSFIRALPITIITALLMSLLVALIFIPFFAKFLLLRKNTMGEDGVKEIAAGIEHKIADFIAKPMLWAKGSMKKLTAVGIAALLIGFGFIFAGGYFATKVAFNIFPPSKDSNDVQVALSFLPGATLQQAENIADSANAIVGDTLGENFKQASYYGTANERSAALQVSLLSYNERKETAPQLIAQLQENLDENLKGASAKVSQVDAGPPATAFTVAIVTEDRDKAFILAKDIAAYMETLELTRPSGETAKVTNVILANPSQISRVDGEQRVTVSAEFDGTDTSALFVLAQSAIEKQYTEEKLAEFGLSKDAVQFDLGQESENQESFAALGIAFPLLLLVIYIVLAVQFRSLLQPILIFFAIPFSFFGISLSLYLTDNPFSFFAMLGFFALIGLSIKNTILLTDYANQARRAGKGAIDAMVEALGERFRPLVATSVTAVVALIPLSIISPFWQGLAVLIIFGLLSSTFLVITVFPYYYLGAEFVRGKISRKVGVSIVAAVILAIIGLTLLVA